MTPVEADRLAEAIQTLRAASIALVALAHKAGGPNPTHVLIREVALIAKLALRRSDYVRSGRVPGTLDPLTIM